MALFKKSDEARWNARHKRIAKWNQPIISKTQRLRAYLNMIFNDHGIFRIIYLNLHHVTPQLWRSAQPTPQQIKKLAHNGVKTIINLRGGREHGSWPLELEACLKHNIVLKEITLRSREAPSVEILNDLQNLFATIEYPALLHCKSGADRAGLASALFLLIHEHASLSVAKQQLSLKYGHFKNSKTGILDIFLDEYEHALQNNPELDFMEWVNTEYQPENISSKFTPGLLSKFISDTVLKRE